MMNKDEFYCIGDEQEIRNFRREIDFGKDSIKEKYDVLLPEYKEIVYNVLEKLVNGKDFFGYNFSRFIKAYQQTTPSVPRLKISKQLLESQKDYNQSELDLDKRLDMAKRTVAIKKSASGQTSQLQDYIKDICDFFLIDMDLLEKGIGKVATIKDEWFDKYMKDDEFAKLADAEDSTKLNLRLRIKSYEEYLRKKGELSEGESVLEEDWAVITYSGMYQMLKQQKSTINEANAVKCLIGELYVRQLMEGKLPVLLKNMDI